MKRWVIGVSGASGTVYARQLMKVLLENDPEVHLEVVFSEAALRVMREEENIKTSINNVNLKEIVGFETDKITFHNNRDIGASIASGSIKTEGMVIAPCSMGTLGSVANGMAHNLMHRAADVTLKEGRKLIIVPRETPLSAIHLENMLKLSKIGVSIVPAMPGFYHQPESISDLVDMMVMKITDMMGYDFQSDNRWKSSNWPIREVKNLNT